MNPTSQHTALAAAEDVLTSLCARYGYEDDGFTPKDWSEWQEARRVKALCAAALSALPAGEVAKLIGRARDWLGRLVIFDQQCHLVQNLADALERLSRPKLATDAPIPMVLHCPACGVQHIDEPNPAIDWNNPPHRSHLCGGCGHIWRPADVFTTGVAATVSIGKNDSPLSLSRPAPGVGVVLALKSLRADGWSVAVHNDYRLDGKPHTFWLFTHPSGRWLKGEGRTDEEAIAAAFPFLLSTPGDAQAGEAEAAAAPETAEERHRRYCDAAARGIDIGPDRDFLARLERGEHLTDDFLRTDEAPAQPDRGMREDDAQACIEFVRKVGRLSHTQDDGSGRDCDDPDDDVALLDRLIGEARDIHIRPLRTILGEALAKATLPTPADSLGNPTGEAG